jgi:general secretion pathway protein G
MRRGNGFTLIELLVVLAIVALMLTLVGPRYFKSIDQSKETLLIENLRLTREVLDRFHADTGRYPHSLDELVERKYLRALPSDPVTGSDTTWQISPPPRDTGAEGAVWDLRSGAPGSTHDGRPFSSL